jgi:hypothetical protein
MAKGAAINPTRDVIGQSIEQPPALPWDSLHQLFGTMGNMNSGNLISAAAGSPSSELSRSRESGDHPPGYALASPSVRGTGGGEARPPTGTPYKTSFSKNPALLTEIKAKLVCLRPQAPCNARHVIALVFPPCRGSTEGQSPHGEHRCRHRARLEANVKRSSCRRCSKSTDRDMPSRLNN